MDTFLWLLVLLGSILILIKSSDILTTYSVEVGSILRIPRFIIGATIVSIGTSLPEIITSIIAINKDAGLTDFVASTVVGSNIANLGLVLGISSIISYQAIFKRKLISISIPLFFIATALFVLTSIDGIFTKSEAVLLLLTYLVFIGYTLSHEKDAIKKSEKMKRKITSKHILWISVSVVGIYIGAEYTIQALLKLAEAFSLSTSTLTLSVVAIGTSLPEVAVSTRAAMKGHYEIAMGNIFGSNMFNILVVMGVLGLMQDLTISPEVLTIGMPFLVTITMAAIFIKIDNKVTIWEGLMLLFIYILFLGKLFAFI